MLLDVVEQTRELGEFAPLLACSLAQIAQIDLVSSPRPSTASGTTRSESPLPLRLDGSREPTGNRGSRRGPGRWITGDMWVTSDRYQLPVTRNYRASNERREPGTPCTAPSVSSRLHLRRLRSCLTGLPPGIVERDAG